MTGEDIEVLEPSEDEVTVWAPEPTGNDEILNQSVEESVRHYRPVGYHQVGVWHNGNTTVNNT